MSMREGEAGGDGEAGQELHLGQGQQQKQGEHHNHGQRPWTRSGTPAGNHTADPAGTEDDPEGPEPGQEASPTGNSSSTSAGVEQGPGEQGPGSGRRFDDFGPDPRRDPEPAQPKLRKLWRLRRDILAGDEAQRRLLTQEREAVNKLKREELERARRETASSVNHLTRQIGVDQSKTLLNLLSECSPEEIEKITASLMRKG